MTSKSKAVLEIAQNLGIRGLIRSVYYSARYASAPKMVLGPRVIPEIHTEAEIDLKSPLLFAARYSGSSHVKCGPSKLAVTETGSLRTTSSDGAANIGPDSIVHIEGEFKMGHSYINSDGRILCEDTISIGDGCAIAWNVTLLDSNRHDLWIEGENRQGLSQSG